MTSRPSASGGDDRERREGDASPTPPVDPADYGFLFDEPGDGWLESVRDAETPVSLGSIGDYELIAEVSRGGQGVVFLARQPGTHRTIALKRLRAGTLSTAAMQQRFQREVEAAAALNHPNIVTVYGMEVVDGLPVFAMEWVDGVPVTEWAAHGEDDERRDPSEMLELFLRICDAVQHAHSRGVLHRDLKPSNILVDECGQPHVLDFGLAMRLEPDATGEILETPAFLDSLTQSADVLGTPAYSAPEQLRLTDGRLDVRADVYSLGVLLYEMLTGRSPYGARRSMAELLTAVEQDDPPKPSAFDDDLDSEIDTIVVTSMAKDREERYSTVAALAADVARYLAGEPVTAVAPSSWYLLRKLVLRNKVVAGFTTTLVFAMVAFGVHAKLQANLLKVQHDVARQALEVSERDRQRALVAEAEMRRALAEVAEARDELAWRQRQLQDWAVYLPDCLLRNASRNRDYVRLSPASPLEERPPPMSANPAAHRAPRSEPERPSPPAEAPRG